ncbi:hypothetical protein [Mycobacterium sp.]|uniref:hypothetical protein n=1 Tax=Mycobacterium sp. TaxID=1785 RepID=UPI0012280844|nr:hypothetical protein [Mycobacterium sp.]TAM62856.1 MAG: hypothetical protein EPN51_28910 [Mycobacterium sp.]
MTEPEYTARDALIHVDALLTLLRNEIQQVRDVLPESVTASDALGHVMARLEVLAGKVDEHRAAHDAYGDVYDSGVPVASVADLGGGHRWQMAWHPSPAHPANTPRTLVSGVRLPDGTTGDVIATAVGVLDVVRRS